MKKLVFLAVTLALVLSIMYYFKKTRNQSKIPTMNLERKMIINYNKNSKSLLGSLCEKYGADKGEVNKEKNGSQVIHSYTDLYSMLFEQNRLNVTKIFECGIGTNNPNFPSNMGGHGKPGASLRVWRDYFPNAVVIGGDIDKDILFQEERIKTHYLDQTDPKSIANFWSAVDLIDFDIMLDDGLHVYDAGITLFKNSINRLSKKGIYIIEDITPKDLIKYQEYFSKNPKYEVMYVNLFKPIMSPSKDDNILIIKHLNRDN